MSDIKSLTFEDAMKKLEDLLNELENKGDSLSSEEIEAKISEAEALRDHCKELLKKEKAEIIKTAKENNIPLKDIGLSEEDDDDYDDIDDDEEEEK